MGSQATKHDQQKPDPSLIDLEILRFLCRPCDLTDLPEVYEQIFERQWAMAMVSLSKTICPYHPSRGGLSELAAALTFGGRKYDRDNWRKGMQWTRPRAACLRHCDAFYFGGEIRDPESGVHHLGHAMACLMFLHVYERDGLGEDDL